MSIDEHLHELISIYNLTPLYNKFTLFTILTSTVRESFYWLLIYFSELVKTKPELIHIFGIILIMLLIIHIPMERYQNSIKTKFLEELKKANTIFFYSRLTKIIKTEILNYDLVEFNNTIEHLNDNLEQHIYNLKIKYEIPLRFVSLVVIAINKKFNLLIGLFFIYFALVKVLNEWKIIKEIKLNDEYFRYENIIRNYAINSKNLLVNNEFNMDYLTNKINEYQKINKNIIEISNSLDMKINISILIYILIVMKFNIENFNPINFLYYFLIVYDIEYIGDKITEYYKNKINLNKTNKRLNYLYKFNIKDLDKYNDKFPDVIEIKQILNTNPKINLQNIIIKKNDHVLINGISGSGKTSLLYIFKGIVKPQYIEIDQNFDYIISQTYLTLSNHKSLFSGYLYDIITNYELKPDYDSIKNSIVLAKFNICYDNKFINIEKLSSGERIRLLVARIIYNVNKNNYKLLLFDEIDENLNDELAVDICKNIKSIFKNKIILYITHNEKVKKLFDKKLVIVNGSNKNNINQ
jgi:ABC-type lipoprotein export system ATPase subunit